MIARIGLVVIAVASFPFVFLYNLIVFCEDFIVGYAKGIIEIAKTGAG